jgi:DNA-binding response OmpR family regulator
MENSNVRPRILVVDDDAKICAMLRKALELEGYDIVEAYNGHEGRYRFLSEQPCLVITDILMPEQDGLQLIRSLRYLTPDVKIIAMTGGGAFGNFDNLRLAQFEGAQRILRKPFSLRELSTIVHDLLVTESLA